MNTTRSALDERDDALISISSGPIMAAFSRYGASLAELRLEGVPHSLVLGYPSASDYVGHGMYFGAIIGRYANRIANARFDLDGNMVVLDANEPPNHLHGGRYGLGVRDWEVAEVGATSICFSIRSDDGDQGYPGNLWAQARYSVYAPGMLELDIRAHCDAPTMVNFCHHPYFDLTGTGGTHDLEIAADAVLISGEDLVPKGDATPLALVPDLDFRAARAIPSGRSRPRINNTYCLSAQTRAQAAFAARLSTSGGPSMELWTNQPGLHLYTGYKIELGPRGHDDRQYGPGAAICLEAQNWPDAPNRTGFPNAILRPGQTYRHLTQYKFVQ